MVKVFINNEVKAKFKHKRLFRKIAQVAIDLLSIEGTSEINVIITNDSNIKELSKNYKKRDKATDVLSFETDWQELKPMIGYNMLGDIYISHEKVTKQAKDYNHSDKREWSYLFAHGLLHLCGYDHQTKKDEKVMNSLAKEIMEKVKVGRDA